MRSSYGILAFLQLGSVVAIATLAALMDAWPPLMFWVVFLGLFAAAWVGLLWRRQVDRRAGR